MGNFAVRFLICNILISIFIGILLTAKHLLRRKLTSQTQYHVWFLLLFLLAVPFLPIRFAQLFSWMKDVQTAPLFSLENQIQKDAALHQNGAYGWMNDFSVAISQNTPSDLGFLLCILWIAGILGMTAVTVRCAVRFHALKKSALPLQNPCVRRLYDNCLSEMNITKNIPVYSTAFLKSPVIAGLLKPCIYLPIHLIADYDSKDLRYMLLHELSHYRHKDSFVNCLMNLSAIAYWFNPFVWYALKEMKNDREMACDASVLNMLETNAYQDYGYTLINFAEKISRSPFPFATGISAGMAQMQKRILNIANFQKTSFRNIMAAIFTYVLLAVVLLNFIPLFSTQAASRSRYAFQEQGKRIEYLDLKAAFGDYEGSFVLYDTEHDVWKIYNKEYAAARTTPVSTYKIYSALLGLETGVISPEDSRIAWDGRHYDFNLWNRDQTLRSAMQNSVTWYFQELDRQAGFSAVRDFIEQTGYGNQAVPENLSSYWTDSSLTISAIEQVELLQKFYYNEFGFSPQNINAVKDSIHMYTNGGRRMYGKTGTGEEHGANTLGWFIGYIEQDSHPCFFATKIRNEELATGSAAAELTFSILSDLHVWQD